MRVLRLGAAVALLAVAPAAAHAQLFGKLKWSGTGNAFVATYKQANNTNVSVYGGAGYRATLSISSSSAYLPPHGTNGAFGPAVDIYCVDFLHHANSSSSGYDAWFTRLDGSMALTRTRSANLTSYLKAAWLIQQMDATGLSDHATRADIHAAIWYMMSGSPIAVQQPNGTFSAAGMNSWLSQANLASNWQSVNGAEWTIVTDACVASGGTAGQGLTAVDNCSQEFLTHNVVPEPATLILLGTGLMATLAVAGVMSRPNA